jgi:glycosyltransferase involved in cell wall biosynthesis
LRPHVRSKFFFKGDEKFYVKGVTYGPFRPSPATPEVYLPDRTTVKRDLALIRELGANTLRVYHAPPRWFLDTLAENDLHLMMTVPWQQHINFLDSRKTRQDIRLRIRDAARSVSGHPALFALLVGNEIPCDMVRWYGRERITSFVDELVEVAKSEDPDALISYANYPPTEYLLPRLVDFYSYNVYLERQPDFRGYLGRLQNLAEEKPIMLGEFGMDTLRNSEEKQNDTLRWHIETEVRGGLAGTVLFSFTDEWFTGGHDITDWAFGLVKHDRTPKLAYQGVKEYWTRPDSLVPLTKSPRVSIVVCSYNGGNTLRDCLESLEKLNYPDYEVILVDDGSKDTTQSIVRDFCAKRGSKYEDVTVKRDANGFPAMPEAKPPEGLPRFLNLVQPNLGLSAARNNGYRSGTGEVIAYTDSDCMADRDWLYYLITTLTSSEHFASVGGPNVSPPARNWVQACVAAAPGSPSHVLTSDTVAEHVPGCNMAYWRWALDMIDGFDVEYRKAGDDVDVCWRLMHAGWQIGFSPSAVVWHYRRFTVKAYFGQQRGYGEAESLLRFKHPIFFGPTGGAKWRGSIYGVPRFASFFGGPIIYHGVFGMGLFQTIYPRRDSEWAGLVSSYEWAMVTLFVFLASIFVPEIRIVPLIMFGLTLAVAISWMVRAQIEPKHDSILGRLLLLYLAMRQPWTRAWARYSTWITQKRSPAAVLDSREQRMNRALVFAGAAKQEFWSESGHGRELLLQKVVGLLEDEGWRYSIEAGWSGSDLEVYGNRWWELRLRTVHEYHGGPKVLVRVGLLPQLSTFSWLFLLSSLTLLVLAFLKYADQPRYPVLAGTIFIGIMGLLLAYRGGRLIYRVAALVEAAAEQCGYVTLGKAGKPTPKR